METQISKRGRGRPRKNVTIELSSSINVIQENVSKEKKGRGRPKKNSNSTVSKSNNATEEINPFLKKSVSSTEPNINTINITEKNTIINFLDEDLDQKFSNISNLTEHEKLIQDEKRRYLRSAFKPSSAEMVTKRKIKHLQDAVFIEVTENGRNVLFNCKVGDTIFIQYPQPWRETNEWLIKDINYENGNLSLKNLDQLCYGLSNYIIGPTVWGIKIKKSQ
jgi:hypothetical protein